MYKKKSLEQFLNYITIEILESLQIYPNTNITELLENILHKHIDAIISEEEFVEVQTEFREAQ